MNLFVILIIINYSLVESALELCLVNEVKGINKSHLIKVFFINKRMMKTQFLKYKQKESIFIRFGERNT